MPPDQVKLPSTFEATHLAQTPDAISRTALSMNIQQRSLTDIIPSMTPGSLGSLQSILSDDPSNSNIAANFEPLQGIDNSLRIAPAHADLSNELLFDKRLAALGNSEYGASLKYGKDENGQVQKYGNLFLEMKINGKNIRVELPDSNIVKNLQTNNPDDGGTINPKFNKEATIRMLIDLQSKNNLQVPGLREESLMAP